MNAPANKVIIHFYRKHGCHLCDDMARGLAESMREWRESGELDSGREYEIIGRDIEDDPRWYRRYREYVPVLVVDGREICHYFLDKDDLKEALKTAPSCK